MKKIIPALVPALVLVFAGLGQTAVAADAAVAKPAPKAAKPAADPAEQSADSEIPADVIEQMNKFVEAAVQGASGPLQKGDEFTPYGVLQLADGTLQVVRWSTATPPPPMEMFRQVYIAIMEQAKNPNVVAAVSVAPTSVPTTDGKMRVNGIRAEVDHRRGAPRLVFIPYTRENGKLVLGTTVYQPGVNPVFDHGKAGATPAADKATPKKKPAAKSAPAKAGAAKPAVVK